MLPFREKSAAPAAASSVSARRVALEAVQRATPTRSEAAVGARPVEREPGVRHARREPPRRRDHAPAVALALAPRRRARAASRRSPRARGEIAGPTASIRSRPGGKRQASARRACRSSRTAAPSAAGRRSRASRRAVPRPATAAWITASGWASASRRRDVGDLVELAAVLLGRHRLEAGAAGAREDLGGQLAAVDVAVEHHRDALGAGGARALDQVLGLLEVRGPDPHEAALVGRVVALRAGARPPGRPLREAGQAVAGRDLEQARVVRDRQRHRGRPVVELAEVGDRARVVGRAVGVLADERGIPGLVGLVVGGRKLPEPDPQATGAPAGLGKRAPLAGHDRARRGGRRAAAEARSSTPSRCRPRRGSARRRRRRRGSRTGARARSAQTSAASTAPRSGCRCEFQGAPF